jgi:hypothetical protein
VSVLADRSFVFIHAIEGHHRPSGRSPDLGPRFCEATIRFQDDHTETAWYRIDALKDGDEQEFNFDLCTLPTDVFQNQCEHARPPKH